MANINKTPEKRSLFHYVKVFIVTVLCLALITTPGGLFSKIAYADEEGANISIKWTSEGQTTGSRTDLTLDPPNNAEQTLTLLLTFKTAGVEVYVPDEIEIRLPVQPFTLGGNGRTGSLFPAPNYVMALGSPGAKTHQSGFYYTVSGSDIVIKNYLPIDSENVFSCELRYKYMPYQIQNGFQKSFSASYSLKDGGITGISAPVSLTVNTKVVAPSITIDFVEKHDSWPAGLMDTSLQSNLPPGADVSDYVFVIWRLYSVGPTGSATPSSTQPYTEVIADQNLAEYKAYIVGTSQSTISSFLPASFSAPDAAVFKKVYDLSTTDAAQRFVYYVIAYPKAEIASHGNKITTNLLHSFNGIDGSSARNTTSAAYQYIQPGATYYPGNLFNTGITHGTSYPSGCNDQFNSLFAPFPVLEEKDESLMIDRWKGSIYQYASPTYYATSENRYYSLTQGDLAGLNYTLDQSVAIGTIVYSGSRVIYTGSLANGSEAIWTQPSLYGQLPANFDLDVASVTIGGAPADSIPIDPDRNLSICFPDMDPGEIVSFSFETVSNGNSARADQVNFSLGGKWGQRDYTTELIDDMVFIDNTMLAPEDYSFPIFMVNVIEYSYENGELRESTDYANSGPVDIYVKTHQNKTWHKIGDYKRISESQIRYNPLGGPLKGIAANDIGSSTTNLIINSIPAPEGIYAVKLSYTGNKAKVDLGFSTKLALHPTQNTKALINGKNGVALRSITTTTQRDDKGNYCLLPGNISSSTGIDATVSAHDLSEGRPANQGHALKEDRLFRDDGGTTVITQTAAAATNDAVNELSSIPYTINAYEMIAVPYYGSIEDYIGMGLFKPQTDGVFCDLLPAGMSVKQGTIQARPYHNSSASPTPAHIDPECISVDEIPDWQGSGRTMMKVHIKLPDGTVNITQDTGKTAYYSGFILYYTLLDPYQNIKDNGNNIENLVAYRSKNEQGLSQGAAATGIFEKYYKTLESGAPAGHLANSLNITFSGSDAIGSGDHIYITDKNGVPTAGSPFTGTQLQNTTVTVPADGFKIRLVTDASGAGFGFKIVLITDEKGKKVKEIPYFESAHSYANNIDSTWEWSYDPNELRDDMNMDTVYTSLSTTFDPLFASLAG